MGKELDRIVMKAAVDLSRRGFFKKLGSLGLGTGLGLAGIGQALACDPCQQTNCGSCGGCQITGTRWNPTKNCQEDRTTCYNPCGRVCRQTWACQ